MKTEIMKASDIFGEPTIIEINTLEDLINLIKKEGPIIIHGIANNQMNITIYDDYIE